jgi:broad specificity phosphatase PhoE
MARQVHLVRHGEVDNPEHVVYAALPGYALTDLGRRQAKEAARYLSSQSIVAVWSSPLERAMATAAVVAARSNLPVLVDPDLTEWKIADGWAGIVWEDLPARRPGELEAYLDHPWDLSFGSESLAELADRMRRVLVSLDARYSDGDVVVVSHQDPVQAARLIMTGRSLETQHRDKPEHCSVITLEPGRQWREVAIWAPEQGDTFPPAT